MIWWILFVYLSMGLLVAAISTTIASPKRWQPIVGVIFAWPWFIILVIDAYRREVR